MSFATKQAYTGITLVLYKSEFNLVGEVGEFITSTFHQGTLVSTSGITAIIDGTHQGRFTSY